MNTYFKTIALIFAAALPVALSAESFGVNLPSLINTSHMFGAFVVALTLLTMSADYRSTKPLRRARLATPAELDKASLRLAA